jgi:hypothetical protein
MERMMLWKPMKEAPRDGRWIIAICNDRVTVHRVSWGYARDGYEGWCSANGFISTGSCFEPRGGWIDCPQPGQFAADGPTFKAGSSELIGEA